MTEIPEHLLKRAEAARLGASAVDIKTSRDADRRFVQSQIPAHLLERAAASRAKRSAAIRNGYQNPKIPYLGMTPFVYNAMVEDIRKAYNEDLVGWDPPPAPSTQYVPWRIWFQQPSSWAVMGFIAAVFGVLLLLAFLSK